VVNDKFVPALKL
jgi:hypothetical protein